MERRYARNIPALTEAECDILKQKRVLVVGCGGLGGHIIDQLARIGVGAIRVVQTQGMLHRESEVHTVSTVSLSDFSLSCFCVCVCVGWVWNWMN